MQNPRYLAIKTLLQKSDSLPFPVLLEKAFEKLANTPNEQRDKAFIMALCYGLLRHFGITKSILKNYQKKDSSDFFSCAINLACYELFYMDTKEHALVNSYVELVKYEEGQQKANAVNAILRKLIANKTSLQAQIQKFQDQIKTHSASNQIPSKKILRAKHILADLPELFTNEVDPRLAELLAEESFVAPIPSYRINTQKKLSVLETSIQISQSIIVDSSHSYKNEQEQGLCTRQGISSALLCEHIANFYHTHNIQGGLWDMCLGRGGKTLGLLEKNIPISLASEPNSTRIQACFELAKRLELNLPQIYEGFAQDCSKNVLLPQNRYFDAILLDAPCTTSGTIARNPEVKYRISQNELDTIVQTQQELLQTAFTHLNTQGYLFYCTCSVFSKENKGQLKTFLQNTEHANLVHEQYIIPSKLDSALQGHDILYFAILQKVA